MGAAAFMDDADGQCLIPGLPDHLASQKILSRMSWWDYESALRVSRGWRTTVHQQSTIRKKKPRSTRLLGCIHPKKPRHQQHQPRSMAISLCNPSRRPVSWETLPPIPGLACGAPLSGRCVSVDNKLYVIGGRDPQSWEFIPDTFMLDLLQAERSWQRLAPMSTPRSAFACVATGGKIFVAGGQGEEVLTLASAEVYDTATDSWEALPDLNIPRTECNAAVIGDRIFVIGGYSSSCCDSTTGELDDSMCSELDEDGGATFWVSSADAISVGSKCWETVDELGPAKELVWEIGSGILQSVDKSALKGFLQRCTADGDGDGWRVVDGKVVCSRRSGGGGGEGEGEEELMLLAAASGGEEVYACSCALDSAVVPVKVKVSLYRGVCGGAGGDDGGDTKWERVECPFELSRYGASCFLV